jgi:hypothetical protein
VKGFYKIAAKKYRLNKEVLNRTRSVERRLRYLHECGLEYVSRGSSRATFIVNNQEVIKVAINVAGIAQNQVEFANLLRGGTIFPKAYDKAPDD